MIERLEAIALWFEHRARVYHMEAEFYVHLSPSLANISQGVADLNSGRAITIREAIRELKRKQQ